LPDTLARNRAQTQAAYVATRQQHAARPRRESVRKRIGKRRARRIDERDGGCCVYCGSDGAGAHLHLDHLKTRSTGGSDDVANLVTACRRCNSARQDMTVAEWSRYAAAKYGIIFSARRIWAHARKAS